MVGRRPAVTFFDPVQPRAGMRALAASRPSTGPSHEANVNSHSKTIPWTKSAIIDVEECIAAGRPVGWVGIEPTT
jgi:hypothetical protein